MAELLTAEAILSANDLTTEDVYVPEWGGTVRIRSLTGAERDRFEASVVAFRKDGTKDMRLANLRARFVALVIVDAEGKRVFSDPQVKALGDKSAAALQRVWDKGREMSGLTDDDVDTLTDENFGDDQSGDSTFD